MHDYEEVDSFEEFDGCADDIDVPELSDATIAELRRDGGVSDELLERIFDNVLGSADTSTPPDRADHPGGEGASAPSPLGGASWRYNHPTGLRLRSGECDELEDAVKGAAPDQGADLVLFDGEQMTTIVVQVKHAPLTQDALALGAATALRAKIDSMPIVDAVRWALESLYRSIGDPPRPPLCPVEEFKWPLSTAERVLTRPGGEHSEAPSGSVSPNPSGAPNAVSATASEDNARTAADQLTHNPKEAPTPDPSGVEAPEYLLPLDTLAHSTAMHRMWAYPVTDVDVVVSLQQQPEPHRPVSAPAPAPNLDDASTEAVDELRRPLRDLARAVNGFTRTHRTATNKIYAGDPNSGDESLVVLTGDLRPS